MWPQLLDRRRGVSLAASSAVSDMMGVPELRSDDMQRRHQRAQRGGLLVRLLGCASPPSDDSDEECSPPALGLVSPHLTRSVARQPPFGSTW